MRGAQILVVEDNAKNMKLVRDVLLATGYRALEATTGGQALALAALLLFPSCAALPLEPLPPAPAGPAGLQKAIDVLAAGFDGYLSKPVDIDELLETVKRYCGGGEG